MKTWRRYRIDRQNLMMKAVTFDLWNTLIQEKDYLEPRTKCLTTKIIDAEISMSSEEIKKAYIAGHDYVHEVWRKENYRYVPTVERLDHILTKLQIDLPSDAKKELIREIEELVLLDPPNLTEPV